MSYLSLSFPLSTLSVTAEPRTLILEPGCTLPSVKCIFTEGVGSLRLSASGSTSFTGSLSSFKARVCLWGW